MAKRPPSNVVSSARVDAALPDEPPRSFRVITASVLAAVAGIAALTAAFGGSEGGCTHQAPPGAAPLSNATGALGHRVGWRADAGVAGSEISGQANAASGGEVALVGSMVTAAPIYSRMEAYRDKRIGYIRQGGRAPAYAAPIQAPNCEAGWFHLLGGGYVCSKFATLDLNHPQVRLGTSPPNVEGLLPYRYVRNVTSGTPLYRSVPSRQQVLQNEPYLRPASQPAKAASRATEASGADIPELFPESDNPYEAAVSSPEPPPVRKPSQVDYDFGKADLKLSDLVEGPESIIARRLVKGFYVAVDKEFNWNDRNWFKTTAALVAPADRFADATPSTLQGVELAGTDPTQAVGFILSTQASRYQVDERHQAVSLGPVPKFAAARLTGRLAELPNGVFRETTEGWWMRSSEGTYTDAGPPPESLGQGEKWIDVNLSRQTLVAFEGTTPTYATLVASGRHAADPTDKLHDHRTIQGTFRIREKHVSITMDGDGPAPGDMPYSIEDVPYVMYFEGSYALHAAFWHQNFGHETSHGCVNLSPLDAKRLFFWTDPKLPEGWHGIIASEENPGTRVVVHE
jgi:hypothetical protein